MLFSVILMLHIAAACMTGAMIVYALFVAVYKKMNSYRTAAFFLGCIAAFEVFSGTVLAIVSPELSAMSLSLHIALYLGVCLAVEFFLYMRMSSVFPFTTTAAPVLASVYAFIVTLSFGF